jgi:hypothetical protein
MARKVTPQQRVAARDKSRAKTLNSSLKQVKGMQKARGTQGPSQPLVEKKLALKKKKPPVKAKPARGMMAAAKKK